MGICRQCCSYVIREEWNSYLTDIDQKRIRFYKQRKPKWGAISLARELNLNPTLVRNYLAKWKRQLKGRQAEKEHLWFKIKKARL